MSSIHENSLNKNYIPIITSSRQDNADVLLVKEAVSKSFQISKKYLFKKLCSFGYFIKKRIGEGSYSKVYAGEYIKEIEKDQQNLLKMKPIAFKIIDKRNTSSDFSKKFLPRELDILKNIKHPYIVKIFSIFEIGPLIAICMDYCQYGDLLKYIQKNGILSEKQAKIFFKQICLAVQYLHEKNIAHRDIKCENVLIHHRLYVKITDFGFARKLDKLCKGSFSSTFCGSTAYAAPEVLRGIPYEPKLYDTWSLGCVLFIMLFGAMPFDDKNVLQTIKKQENYDINFPKDKRINIRVKDLIRHLLDPDVKTRYFIGEIMGHIWLGIIDILKTLLKIINLFSFNNNSLAYIIKSKQIMSLESFEPWLIQL